MNYTLIIIIPLDLTVVHYRSKQQTKTRVCYNIFCIICICNYAGELCLSLTKTLDPDRRQKLEFARLQLTLRVAYL